MFREGSYRNRIITLIEVMTSTKPMASRGTIRASCSTKSSSVMIIVSSKQPGFGFWLINTGWRILLIRNTKTKRRRDLLEIKEEEELQTQINQMCKIIWKLQKQLTTNSTHSHIMRAHCVDTCECFACVSECIWIWQSNHNVTATLYYWIPPSDE